MRNTTLKVIEALALVESSPRLYAANLATGLVPSLTLLFGSSVAESVHFNDPLTALAAPILRGYMWVICGIAGVSFFSLAALSYRLFRCARSISITT
jgi:hypothetical protein